MSRQPNFTRYVGIPFEARGRSFRGADCYGLVALFHREEYDLDLNDPSALYWGNTEDVGKAEVFSKAPGYGWVAIERDAVQLGDVLVFRIKGHPIHCGIALDQTRMLHLLEGVNSVIESWTGPVWAPRFVQAYRRGERMGA